MSAPNTGMSAGTTTGTGTGTGTTTETGTGTTSTQSGTATTLTQKDGQWWNGDRRATEAEITEYRRNKPR